MVEIADPDGVRGHTMYHKHSPGSLSYAEFRHLGKKDILGKYALHFHLCRDTMRGSSVVGCSIWDSHNRWLTIHGTDYLVVRDNVGYKSVGHGFFLEDGTEVYNVLDRNLAVGAVKGKKLPKQVLPFDGNEGAGLLVDVQPEHVHAERRSRVRQLRLPLRGHPDERAEAGVPDPPAGRHAQRRSTRERCRSCGSRTTRSTAVTGCTG